MVRRPAISKGELEVARVVWNLEEATVGQVFDAMPKQKKVDYTTVQTYLRRLEDKGYLRTRREGRNKVYRPKVRPNQVIRETLDDFLDRLFDGEVLTMMHHLVRDRGISREESEQLRALLDKWEAEDDEP